MKIRPLLLPLLLVLLSIPSALHAANGTWINTAGGSWTNTVNWSGGTVAGGVDSTGFFNTIDITGTTAVTLDGVQTVGNLFFSDITAPVTSWVVNPGTGGSLTLAVSTGSPKITLTNAQAVINAVIGGTSGLAKAGAGTLLLTASNTFTGTVVVDSASAGNDSRLAFTTPAAFAGQNIQLGLTPDGSTSRIIASGGELTLTNNIEIRSVRTVVGNDVVAGLISSNQTWTGNVLLNHAASGVRDFIMQKNLTISGVISGGPAGLILNSGNLTLNGQNTYTNATIIQGGNLFAGCPTSNALPAGSVSLSGGRLILNAHEQVNDLNVPTFTLAPAINNSRFQLNGFNETVAGIQDNATNGNRIVEAVNDGVSNKVSILTLNTPSGSNYTHKHFIRNGGSTSNFLFLVKKGLGQQTFSATAGLVNYSGTTTVEQGVLELASTDSVLNSSPIVLNGGTILFNLTGTGTRNNALTPITGNGTLIKSGTGALVLDTPTTNNFTGSTVVSNGTLQVKGILGGNAATVAGGNLENLGELQATSVTVNGGSLIAGSLAFPSALISGAVTVNGGTLRGWAIVDSATLQSGTINPGLGTSTDTLTISNLTLASGSTMTLDVDPLTTGASDLIPTANLTVSGPATISFAVPPGGFALSRYVIMTYSVSATGLGNLSLAPALAGSRYGLAIDTSVLGEVAITVANPSGTPKSLTWVGELNAGAWDINSTTNWLDVSTPEKFYNADAVSFDDTASNTAVNVTATVYPGLVAFNNSASNYTASGAGKIIATAGLSKSGSANLTLNIPYEGGAVANSGGGTLTVTNSIIGTQLLIDSGSTVSLTGTNFFNGSFVVDAANTGGSTLMITSGGYLHAPVSGGSFNLVNNSNQIVVAGAGSMLNVPGVGGIQIGNSANATGNRVILRDGGAWTNIPNNLVLPNGVNASDNHLIMTNGGQFVWSPTGAGNLLLGHSAGAFNNSLEVLGASSVLDLKGKALYAGRQGSNNVAVINGGVATNVGVINVNDLGAGQGNGLRILNGGRLYNSGGINLGPNANASVGAFLTVDNASVWASAASIGGNVAATGTTLTLTNGGSLTISNTLTVNNPSAVVNFSSGTLTIGGANVKNGLIFTVGDGVNATTLALTGGSFTFTNGLTISANATLKGTGTVNDNTLVNGSFTPGSSIGAITFTNSLTLAGSTVMEIDKANLTNDSATVTGALTYGGTLMVTNLGGTLAPGDTYKLFNFTGTPGSFASVTLPSLAGGLAWTNKLAVDGSIQVISVGPSIPATPTNLTFSVSGGNLTLSWPSNYVGWILQSQTNARSDGLKVATSNWLDVAGSGSLTSTNVPVSPVQPTVFFRLRYP